MWYGKFYVNFCWSGIVLISLLVAGRPVQALLSDSTGQIQGKGPTLNGTLQAYYPDGAAAIPTADR